MGTLFRVCINYEKFGLCARPNCAFFHRRMMSFEEGCPPKIRRECTHGKNCPKGLDCKYMHFGGIWVSHQPYYDPGPTRFVNNEESSNGQGNYGTHPPPYPFNFVPPMYEEEYYGMGINQDFRRKLCIDFNTPSGCLRPNCPMLHEKIRVEQKKVVILLGSHNSGKSALGNVMLQNRVFHESNEELLKYLDATVTKSYSRDFICVDVESFGDETATADEMLFKLGEVMVHISANDVIGFNSVFYLYDGKTKLNLDAIKLLAEFLGSKLNEKFLFVYTHLGRHTKDGWEELQKRRVGLKKILLESIQVDLNENNITCVNNPTAEVQGSLMERKQNFYHLRSVMKKRFGSRAFADIQWRKSAYDMKKELEEKKKMDEDIFFMQNQVKMKENSQLEEKLVEKMKARDQLDGNLRKKIKALFCK